MHFDAPTCVATSSQTSTLFCRDMVSRVCLALVFLGMTSGLGHALTFPDSEWVSVMPEGERPLVIEALPDEEARIFVGIKSGHEPREVRASGPVMVRDDRARAVNVGLESWKPGDRFEGWGSVLVGLDVNSLEGLERVSGWVSDWESTVEGAVPRMGAMAVLKPEAQGDVVLLESPEEPLHGDKRWELGRSMALVLTPQASVTRPVHFAPDSVVLVVDPTQGDLDSKDTSSMTEPKTVLLSAEQDASFRGASLWIQRQSRLNSLATAWLPGEWVATPTGWGIRVKQAKVYPDWWAGVVQALEAGELPLPVMRGVDLLTQRPRGIEALTQAWSQALDDRYVGTQGEWPLGLSNFRTPMQLVGSTLHADGMTRHAITGAVVLTDFTSPVGEVGLAWQKYMLRRSEDYRARLTAWGAWMGHRHANWTLGVGLRRESGFVVGHALAHPVVPWRMTIRLPWKAWVMSGMVHWEEESAEPRAWYGSLEVEGRYVESAHALWQEGQKTLGQWSRSPMVTLGTRVEGGYRWYWGTRADHSLSLGVQGQISRRFGGEKKLVTSTGKWQAVALQESPQGTLKGLLHTSFLGGWVDLEAQAGFLGSKPLWLGQMRWSYRF